MRLFAIVAIIPMLLCVVAARATVTLRWDTTGHVIVPVVVNGTGPFPFLIDTGADESAVYQWFASARGLPKGHREQISGAVGDEAEMTTLLETLSLDEHVIRHVDADTLPDRADGARIAGVAGVDLMTGRIAVLDTGCATAALLPGGTDPSRVAGIAATLIKAGGIQGGKQLTLPVWIKGVKGTATLDTGARTTIINRKFARAAGLNPDLSAFKVGPPVHGATTQTVSSRLGVVGTVQFAGLKRDKVVARIVDLPVFADAGYAGGLAMNLGLDLLHNTRLTIDYRRRKFWLAESSCRL